LWLVLGVGVKTHAFFKGVKMFKKFDITDSMFQNASLKAAALGVRPNSITSGQGNIVGFLGEEVARLALDGIEKNSFEHDMLLQDGRSIEVKTQKLKYEPKPHFTCYVSAFNPRQVCDYYCFVGVDASYKKGWYLGVYPKREYMQKATFLKAGDNYPGSVHKVKANCYTMKLGDLLQQP
jgi:hypothetical protein